MTINVDLMGMLEQGQKESFAMIEVVKELEQNWYLRLQQEGVSSSQEDLNAIVRWLIGENPEKIAELAPNQVEITKQALEYRYRILRQRYWGKNPTQAYKNLINRLGSLTTLRNKIRTWVALSRDRQRAVADVIQEVVQEMLNSDRYIQQQINWISQCTQKTQLKNILLLATVEEYSLRPIRSQPLLVYRFVNFLRRSQKGGMTQVPQKEMIKLISEELAPDDTDSPVSLLDYQAVSYYEEQQSLEEQQRLRILVQQEFEAYLAENVDPIAVTWLKLYLQGQTQEAIAQALDLPIKKVYRLREKISYHALKVFSLKEKPELVATWLEISLKEHNLGLTPQQWEKFWQELTPTQQQILQELKAGQSLEAIAKSLNWKMSQIMGEWSKIYFIAQNLRTN
jgi:DNA-binding CsgD family transcriptional regulator